MTPFLLLQPFMHVPTPTHAYAHHVLPDGLQSLDAGCPCPLRTYNNCPYFPLHNTYYLFRDGEAVHTTYYLLIIYLLLIHP